MHSYRVCRVSSLVRAWQWTQGRESGQGCAAEGASCRPAQWYRLRTRDGAKSRPTGICRGIGCPRKLPGHHDLNTGRHTAAEASDRSQARSRQMDSPRSTHNGDVSHGSLSWLLALLQWQRPGLVASIDPSRGGGGEVE